MVLPVGGRVLATGWRTVALSGSLAQVQLHVSMLLSLEMPLLHLEDLFVALLHVEVHAVGLAGIIDLRLERQLELFRIN